MGDNNPVMNPKRLFIQVLALNGAVVTGVLRPLELGAPHLGVVRIDTQQCVRVLDIRGPMYTVESITGMDNVHPKVLRSFEPVETLELGPVPALSVEELATILFALRYVQEYPEDVVRFEGSDILTSDGGKECDLLLQSPAIDALCERLDTSA